MEKTGKRTKNVTEFLRRNYALFLAPLFVLFAYIIQLAVYGVRPFGETFTAASYDLSAQISPFVEHLFDVMDGKSSLFYSYAVAGGADVFGTFAYFFISPFSFLFLTFGDGRTLEASAIVMLAKLVAIAFSGAWFAQKLFKGIPAYLCAALGVVYTYCGYTFVSNTYINWMDFLIYAPFAVAAFVRFYKTGKFLRFSALLALCVYTCFSIVCFSFFTLFPALVAFAFFCVPKENRKEFLCKLCFAFVVTVLIALPVLVPALVAYLNGGRGGGLFENLWSGFSGGVFNSSSYFETWGISLYQKWSYIFSDAIFVTLTLFYFVRSRLRTGLSKFMLVTGVLTLLPVLVDESMNLLNMGSYMSYALRFGFLNAIYFFGGACLAIQGFCYAGKKAYDGGVLKGELLGEKLQNDGSRVALNDETPKMPSAFKRAFFKIGAFFSDGYRLAYFILALVVATFLSVFVITNQYWEFWGKIFKDKDGLNAERFFSSSFAHSLGGLPTIVLFFLLTALVTVLGILLAKKKRIGLRALSLILTGLVCVQVIFFNEQLVLGNRSDIHVKTAEYQRLSQTLNERDDSYFRVKDVNDKLTSNIPFAGDSNSFSVFSSVIDEDNFVVYNLFGYWGNGKNNLKSTGGNAFANSFLGCKYYFYDVAKKTEADGTTYLAPVYEEGEELLEGDTFCVYENTICFPSGYVLPNGEFRFAAENTSANRTKNQRELYRFLGGNPYDDERSPKVSEVRKLSQKLWENAAEVTVGTGKIKAKVTASAGECLFLNFVASKGYTVTVNGKKAELIDNDLRFLSVELEEGENEVVFSYSSPYVAYAGVGCALAVVGLLIVAFVVRKERLTARISPVIAWAGVGLAIGVTAFFMAFPTGVWLYKLLRALLGLF